MPVIGNLLPVINVVALSELPHFLEAKCLDRFLFGDSESSHTTNNGGRIFETSRNERTAQVQPSMSVRTAMMSRAW